MRRRGQKRADYALALCNLNRLAAVQQALNFREMVAEIPDGNGFHVIHFNITSRPDGEPRWAPLRSGRGTAVSVARNGVLAPAGTSRAADGDPRLD